MPTWCPKRRLSMGCAPYRLLRPCCVCLACRWLQSDNCPKRRRELRPLTEVLLGAGAGGGAMSPGDNALADDLWEQSAAAGVGGAAGADAAAGSGGSDATAAGTGSTISRSPFGRAVTALRQFYAPHMQQLFRWADQGVIPQPPQAWRDAYGSSSGSSSDSSTSPGRRLRQLEDGSGGSGKLRG